MTASPWTYGGRPSDLVVGDKVKYRATFLRSIGCYTGPVPFARGVITAIDNYGPFGIAHIKWDVAADELPDKVNTKNLIKCGVPEAD